MYKTLKVINVWFVIVCNLQLVEPANILAVIPSPSYSHQVTFRPIWRALAQKGHHITLITTDPMNEDITNIKEIDIHHTYDVLDRHNFTKLLNEFKYNLLKVLSEFGQIILDIDEEIMENEQVSNLIKDGDAKFDLLMLEFVNPIVVPFMHRFKAPAIALLSFDAHVMGHNAMGNPTHPILYPDVNLGLQGDLTFLERLVSTAFRVYMDYFLGSISTKIDEMTVKYFGNGYPPISELSKNIDMLFINSNPVLNHIRPSVPATVHLNGLHLTTSQKLPKDLQLFLDGSKSGVIYFSLGTNVKSANLDLNVRRIILETLAELPYDVLWKFEGDEMADLPSNVKIMKWVPQQAVLQHPKIKLFITQGGVQSLEESVYSEIPMVGMPFLGEQESNVKLMVQKKLGLAVSHYNLEKDAFKNAILEVINNPKYKETAKQLAKLALDQPMSGVDKAVWWTEYVLRHNGSKHLKGRVDLPAYQYYLLDVFGFISCVFFIVLCVTYQVIKYCPSLCHCIRKSNKKDKAD